MNIHPLQTKTWAEFREKTGVKVITGSNFYMTLHPVPKTSWNIGYVPKGHFPDKKLLTELVHVGKQEKCIFIQLEPNVVKHVHNNTSSVILRETKDLEILRSAQNDNVNIVPSAHPLFTKYTFMLDLTKSEEELLKNMHPKTRYNIRVAQKRGVSVADDSSDEAFETFLKLNHDTNTRQKFYSHPDSYFRTLRALATEESSDFSFYLLTATYQGKILTAWVLFVCGDTLYYPYGASSSEHRDVMANNLIMWEAILFGKKHNLKTFDMWGALGPEPDVKDPWFGFHRFKAGYGATHTEFVGSFDLVINPLLYQIYKVADKLRWMYLRILKMSF